MAYPYITKADLEDRVSAETVKQVCDDDNDGVSDDGPVNRILADASSVVAGYLRGIYSLDTIAAAPPNEVIRLSLDVAEVMVAKRHPEYYRRDWEKLENSVTAQLKALRKGETRLDVVTAPEPGANEGGSVRSGIADATAPKPKFALDGTGDF